MECKSCGCEQITLGTTDECFNVMVAKAPEKLCHWLVGIVSKRKLTKEARPLWWSTFCQLHERPVVHCVLNYDLDKFEKFEKL